MTYEEDIIAKRTDKRATDARLQLGHGWRPRCSRWT